MMANTSATMAIAKKNDDEIAFEPVFGLSAIENHFQARECHGHGENSPAIDFQFAVFARGFHFTLEFRRIGEQAAGEDQRDDADRDVDEENPAPAPVVGDPAAERRTDCRRGDDSHAVEREGCGALMRRESIDEDRLLDRCEPAAADSLQDAEKDEGAEAGSKTAQQRTDGEERDANHVVAFAPEAAAEPRGERQDDGVGDEIAGEHPGAFVGADGEAAGDMRKRDVGDGGVEQFHEGRQGDGDGDEPWIDAHSRSGKT